MTAMQGFMTILGQIWNGIFGLQSPFWGLTFKQIFVGLFVVLISIRVLFPLLGLGAGVLNNVSSLASRRAKSSRSGSSSGGSSLPKHTTGSVSGSGNPTPRYFNDKPMYKRTK